MDEARGCRKWRKVPVNDWRSNVNQFGLDPDIVLCCALLPNHKAWFMTDTRSDRGSRTARV